MSSVELSQALPPLSHLSIGVGALERAKGSCGGVRGLDVRDLGANAYVEWPGA